jgi:hypothetical protein
MSAPVALVFDVRRVVGSLANGYRRLFSQRAWCSKHRALASFRAILYNSSPYANTLICP